MNKEEIKEYLKRVDELWNKLTGEDKETYAWLIYGYNKCAKLLNETEKENKKYKEAIDKIRCEFLKYDWKTSNSTQIYNQLSELFKLLSIELDILKEV